MPDTPLPIEDRIAAQAASLTPLERALTAHLARHWPVAGLGPMSQLAREAKVSMPTVLRLVRKLGFAGYPDFQTQLRAEVEARLETPPARRERWSSGVPQAHILNRFADAVLANLSRTLERVDHAEFDACAALLADPKRRVHAVGGRITHALARYLAMQLSLVRPGVAALPDAANAWPAVLLDLAPGDVLIVFDIRRYEAALCQLAELAAGQGAEVLLLTDPWVSPVARHASRHLSAQIEAPSAWDSSAALLVLVETLLAAVQEQVWPETEARMRALETLYDRASLFRDKR